MDLGVWSDSSAYGISNPVGVGGTPLVVGSARLERPGVSGEEEHAWLWRHGTMYDLNNHIPTESPWILVKATAVNDNGWIVGWGYNTTASEAYGSDSRPLMRAFVLRPISATSEIEESISKKETSSTSLEEPSPSVISKETIKQEEGVLKSWWKKIFE